MGCFGFIGLLLFHWAYAGTVCWRDTACLWVADYRGKRILLFSVDPAERITQWHLPDHPRWCFPDQEGVLVTSDLGVTIYSATGSAQVRWTFPKNLIQKAVSTREGTFALTREGVLLSLSPEGQWTSVLDLPYPYPQDISWDEDRRLFWISFPLRQKILGIALNGSVRDSLLVSEGVPGPLALLPDHRLLFADAYQGQLWLWNPDLDSLEMLTDSFGIIYSVDAAQGGRVVVSDWHVPSGTMAWSVFSLPTPEDTTSTEPTPHPIQLRSSIKGISVVIPDSGQTVRLTLYDITGRLRWRRTLQGPWHGILRWSYRGVFFLQVKTPNWVRCQKVFLWNDESSR